MIPSPRKLAHGLCCQRNVILTDARHAALLYPIRAGRRHARRRWPADLFNVAGLTPPICVPTSYASFRRMRLPSTARTQQWSVSAAEPDSCRGQSVNHRSRWIRQRERKSRLGIFHVLNIALGPERLRGPGATGRRRICPLQAALICADSSVGFGP